jgi:hypothetical protein
MSRNISKEWCFHHTMGYSTQLVTWWPASSRGLGLPCLSSGWRDWNGCLRTMVIIIHKLPVGWFTFLQCLSGTNLLNLSGTPYKSAKLSGHSLFQASIVIEWTNLPGKLAQWKFINVSSIIPVRRQTEHVEFREYPNGTTDSERDLAICITKSGSSRRSRLCFLSGIAIWPRARVGNSHAPQRFIGTHFCGWERLPLSISSDPTFLGHDFTTWYRLVNLTDGEDHFWLMSKSTRANVRIQSNHDRIRNQMRSCVFWENADRECISLESPGLWCFTPGSCFRPGRGRSGSVNVPETQDGTFHFIARGATTMAKYGFIDWMRSSGDQTLYYSMHLLLHSTLHRPLHMITLDHGAPAQDISIKVYFCRRPSNCEPLASGCIYDSRDSPKRVGDEKFSRRWVPIF